MMNKNLVIDLDDTISFCHDRDWVNARPNIPVIRKINSLYNQGWNIEIFSARGTLSKTDYFDQVTCWLQDNGVLYTSLKFGKPLGTLYVDDKGCNPTDFVYMPIETLKGWSGSEVLRIGNRIHKIDKNIKATVSWYEYYSDLLHTPKVLATTGSELVLQYIEPRRKTTFDDALDALSTIVSLSETYTPPINYDWLHYINRVAAHTKNIYIEQGVSLGNIMSLLSMFQPVHSLSHGDLTPDNLIINRSERIFFIDPIASTYSSHEIDRAKLIAWGITHQDNLYKVDNGVHTWDGYIVSPLVISELIRTIMYAAKPYQQIIIPICLNYLNNYEKKTVV